MAKVYVPDLSAGAFFCKPDFFPTIVRLFIFVVLVPLARNLFESFSSKLLHAASASKAPLALFQSPLSNSILKSLFNVVIMQ